MKNKMYFSLLFSALFTFMFCECINAQIQTADYYDVKAGQGKGIRLWSNNNYKIHMGNSSKYHYGPVTGYSMKVNMNNDPARGWTWGVLDTAPVAALNTQGNFQIKGWMKIASTKDASGLAGSGGLEIGNALRIDGDEIITNTNTTLYLQHGNNGDVSFDQNTLWVDASTNRIGIGFSVPAEKLEVKGTVRATSSTTRNHHTEIGHTGYHGFINTYGAGDLLFRHHGSTLMRLRDNGKVVIGNVSSPTDDYRLYVEKGILTEKVKVAIESTSDWSDYVFEEDYEIMPIDELGDYVTENKHLPNVPSAEEMVKGGLDVATMDAKLLEKIEEAYLYIIQLENRIKTLEEHSK